MMFRFVVGVMRVGREEGNGTVAEGLPLWVVGITMVVVGTSGSVTVVLALTLDVVSALLKSSVVCVRKENCEGMLNVALLVADDVVSEKDEEVVKLGKTSEIVIMFDEVIVTVVILPELVTVFVPLDVVPDTIGELVVTVAVAVSLPVLVVWLSVTIGVDDVCVCVPVLVVLVSITSLVLELLPVGVVSVPELVGVVTMPDEVVVGNKSDVNELIRDDVKLLMTDVGSDSEIDSDSDSETEEAVVVGFTGLLVVVGNKSEVSELMMLVIGNERDKLGSELVVAVAGEAEVVGSSLPLTLAVEVGNNTEVSESIMLDSGDGGMYGTMQQVQPLGGVTGAGGNRRWTPNDGMQNPFASPPGSVNENDHLDPNGGHDGTGQHRRSFFFAEDELNGYEDTSRDIDTGSPPQGSLGAAGGGTTYYSSHRPASQYRRGQITPGVISAPILRESSLNW